MKARPTRIAPGIVALCAALVTGVVSAEGLLNGEQAFAACAACHSIEPGAPHKVGPNLHGIVGNSAAAKEGYSYSPALQESGLKWTRETLFAWIAGSEQLVPGSWMLYANELRPEEVQALIDYLAPTED